ncbi:MAG: class B sortase [Lachnospiraceae bacterium]|jgi:sortase B|nr:class B sortase [Lachnospiraceae bacterium]
MKLKNAAAMARIGDRILNLVILMVILLFFLWGTYALWDNYKIYQNAYAGRILAYKPDAADPSGPTLSDLQQVNPDTRAWLVIDDTHIDYPVVQGSTNEKYLNRDIYGSFSLSGTIFLDFRNTADFSDFYNIVYGHHMSGGAMFGDIENFRDENFFQTHTSGTLYLPGQTFRIRLFACLKSDGYDEQLFSTDYTDPERQDALLRYFTLKALQYREPVFDPQKKILALSTCSDASTDERTILLGTLLSEEQ